MQIHAQKVVGSEAGDYFQLHFGPEEDDSLENPHEPQGPYLLVQREFEWAEDDLCYVESDDEEYIGNFSVRIIEFSRVRLEIELNRATMNRVVVNYELSESEFADVQRIGLIVLGVRKPEPPDDDAL